MMAVSVMKRKKKHRSLRDKYPPSEPCSCEICRSYCVRPGWWTVEEASKAIKAGYGHRMMLEIAPEMTFGVLSPAFKGCEGFMLCRSIQKTDAIFIQTAFVSFSGQVCRPLNAAIAIISEKASGRNAMRTLKRTGAHRSVRPW